MNKTLSPAKGTKSYQAYKRATFWQIIFPMVIIGLLFIAVSVFVALRPAETASQWADVSAIWLLIPLIIFALVNLLLLGGLIYGLAKLLDIIPHYTQKLHGFVRLAGEKIETFADATAKPIFMLEGFSASLRRIFRQK